MLNVHTCMWSTCNTSFKKKKRDPGVHMWTCTTHMCTVPHVCTHAVATVRTNIMV